MTDLQIGEKVVVAYPDSSARSEKPAIVKALPPTTEKLCGEEITYTDKVKVQYTGGLQATEFVEEKQIRT